MKHSILFLKRIGLAFALYCLFRTLFLLFHLGDIIDAGLLEITKAFYVGLIFDASAIVYTFSLFILFSILPIKIRNEKWYQKTLMVLFLLPTFLGLLLTILDLNWVKYTGKRSGIELFTILTDEGNNIMSYIKDYWYLAILIMVLFYFVYKLYPRLKSNHETFVFKEIVFFILIAALALLGARGGIGLKPIKSFAAAKYVSPELVNFTLNTPFNIISTVEGKEIPSVEFMSEKEAQDKVPQIKNYGTAPMRESNVVVFILESFGREYIGHLGGTKPSTPFLDSLSNDPNCVSLKQFYANGTKSMEAVPSIFSGLPSWMELPYINSIYHTNQIENIGALLEKNGYTSSFFHGSNNGTMGFQNFLKISGMPNYYGIEEYPNKEKDYDGFWGIYDGPYFQNFLEYIDKSQKPTFASIFSLSSHHPYPIPPELQDKFSLIKDEMSRGVAYTDYALKKFFEVAKTKDWFSNTLFIITADHTSKSKKSYFKFSPGKYEVPCMFYKVSEDWKINENKMASHMDLLPSIMDYIHIPDSFYSLGNSILSHDQENLILYSNGLYWIRDSDYYWLTMTEEGIIKSYFKQEKDERLRKYKVLDNRSKLLHDKLMAYVQVYINNMVSNKMKAN